MIRPARLVAIVITVLMLAPISLAQLQHVVVPAMPDYEGYDDWDSDYMQMPMAWYGTSLRALKPKFGFQFKIEKHLPSARQLVWRHIPLGSPVCLNYEPWARDDWKIDAPNGQVGDANALRVVGSVPGASGDEIEHLDNAVSTMKAENADAKFVIWGGGRRLSPRPRRISPHGYEINRLTDRLWGVVAHADAIREAGVFMQPLYITDDDAPVPEDLWVEWSEEGRRIADLLGVRFALCLNVVNRAKTGPVRADAIPAWGKAIEASDPDEVWWWTPASNTDLAEISSDAFREHADAIVEHLGGE